MTCELCGLELDYKAGKAGRPPSFHKKCKKLVQLLSWIENLLIEFDGTRKAKSRIRSRLWYLANVLNARGHN